MSIHPMIHDRQHNWKQKTYNDYANHYLQYFKKLKNEPIKILEFGILEGYSVEMWEKEFPNAQIFAVDTNSQNFVYKPKRAKYIMGDLDQQEFRNQVKQHGPWDIIIDDASHYCDQQVTLFKEFWPQIKDQGVYVVEDLLTSYWPKLSYAPKEQPLTGIDYLKTLVDHLNSYTDKQYEYGSRVGQPLNELDKTIYSIHFYSQIAFIFKGHKEA